MAGNIYDLSPAMDRINETLRWRQQQDRLIANDAEEQSNRAFTQRLSLEHAAREAEAAKDRATRAKLDHADEARKLRQHAMEATLQYGEGAGRAILEGAFGKGHRMVRANGGKGVIYFEGDGDTVGEMYDPSKRGEIFVRGAKAIDPRSTYPSPDGPIQGPPNAPPMMGPPEERLGPPNVGIDMSREIAMLSPQVQAAQAGIQTREPMSQRDEALAMLVGTQAVTEPQALAYMRSYADLDRRETLDEETLAYKYSALAAKAKKGKGGGGSKAEKELQKILLDNAAQRQRDKGDAYETIVRTVDSDMPDPRDPRKILKKGSELREERLRPGVNPADLEAREADRVILEQAAISRLPPARQSYYSKYGAKRGQAKPAPRPAGGGTLLEQMGAAVKGAMGGGTQARYDAAIQRGMTPEEATRWASKAQ